MHKKKAWQQSLRGMQTAVTGKHSPVLTKAKADRQKIKGSHYDDNKKKKTTTETVGAR